MKYVIPIVVVVLALLGASGIYIVGQGHAAVLTRLGHVASSDIGPGLHFKLPLVEEVTLYDTRAIVLRSEPQDYKTDTGDSVRVGLFVRWRVVDPGAFFKATAGDDLQVTEQMTPVVRTALREQIAHHGLADLLSSDGGAIDRALRDAVSGPLRTKLGIEILGIGVERVLPPDETLASVYKRMSVGADAQARTLRDQGGAKAAAIRAQGDAADQQALAVANQAAAKVRGAGDADAAKIYAAASARNPQFFAYWTALETWRKTFGDGGAVVVLGKDSPFMQAISEGTANGTSAPKH